MASENALDPLEKFHKHAGNVPTKILVCQHVPKKLAILVCLAMSKLKMNQHVPSKNADLLKKISLMETEHTGIVRMTKSPYLAHINPLFLTFAQSLYETKSYAWTFGLKHIYENFLHICVTTC